MERSTLEYSKKDSPVEVAIRIGVVALVLIWCFLIFRPFLTLVIWSIIIAVTAYPVYKKVSAWLGGRKKTAAVLMVLLAVAVIIVPSTLITGSIIRTGKTVLNELEGGTLTINPPPEKVMDWPLIGERTYELWSEASTNLEATIRHYREEVSQAVGWFFRSLAGIGMDVVITILALLIAGVLLINAERGERAAFAFFTKMVGKEGKEFCTEARDTIRSVVQGVVLVAVVQSVLAWAGFAAIDLPAAGVWAIIVLLLAIMQLPAIIVMLPLIIYVFSYASTGAAIAFTVWSILVAVSDSILKPMFLGRGLQTPMLVILIGALGGMMLHGFIGLFVGAVVLALGYKLYLSWLKSDKQENPVMEAGVMVEK